MEKAFPLTIIASVFLLFTASIFSMPVPPNHPLCISQFALANQACSMLPFTNDVPVRSGEATVFTLGTPNDDESEEGDEDSEGEDEDDEDDNEDVPQTGSGPHDRHESDRDDDGSGDSGGSGSSGSSSGGSGSPSGGGGGGGSSGGNSGGRGHRGRRHRHSGKDNGHKKRRHSRHHEKPETSECCKWLKEVDASCVCDLLVRLPVFLRRPTHSIVVKVDHACDVTYACLGRLLQ